MTHLGINIKPGPAASLAFGQQWGFGHVRFFSKDQTGHERFWHDAWVSENNKNQEE